MTTIAQTLVDIENIQQDIRTKVSSGNVQRSPFIDALRHIIHVYHCDLLAHSSLDESNHGVSSTANPFLVQYRSLSRKEGIHTERIRWVNIGGLVIVCTLFEKFVRDTYAQVCTNETINHLKDAYEQILERKTIDTTTVHRMVREFSLLRFIRNSFYHDDTYTNPITKTFDFGDETYELEEGKPVKPIRLMTAITIFWHHYSMIMASE